jgi:hypothetical protein
MNPITHMTTAQALQGFTRSAEVTPTQATDTTTQDATQTEASTDVSDFEAHLRQFLPTGAAEINEEELYSSLVGERIAFLKSDEIAAQYQEALSAAKGEHTRADGYVFVEDATNSAIEKLVADGVLTAEEAGSVKDQAFMAAQLDGNAEALYDGRGSGEDPTIAVESMETALIAAQAMLLKLNDNPELATGEAVADPNAAGGTGGITVAAGETKEGNPSDGQEGFLFKPESESNGNLVVLLPAEFTGSITDLILKDAEGNEIERGTLSGVTNGGRDTFRFTKPGGDYPENLTVEMKLDSGGTVTYSIPDPSERVD